MNLLADGATWLADQLKNNAGTSVTVVRRNGGTGSFTATIGQTPFESQGNNGVTTLIRSRDVLVAVADYKINNVATEPEKHDILTFAVAGVSTQHEVLEDASGRFFNMDQTGTRYRIHTKEK